MLTDMPTIGSRELEYVMVARQSQPGGHAWSSPANGTGPLAGVRVIDLTAMVMGPYCTQIMADMGADVIKVEPPDGDNTRYISVGPAPGMSGVFVNVNRGKRSVVLDLRSDAGKAALARLIEQADVFIHSMRAKAIAKLGFSYDDVAAINPTIVYTNCYGYSRRGPDRDLTAYDDTIQAECGLPAVQQMLTGEANFVGTIMADKVAGLTALYATMMALFHRERTGEGQEVEVSMFETMASFMLVEHANGAMFTPPLGPAHLSARGGAQPQALPHEGRLHRRARSTTTSNGPRSSKPCGRRGRATRFATLEQRARQIDTVYGLLAETFKERTTQEWLELFRKLDIPAAPLRTPDELFDNPHLNAVGFFETVETPARPGALSGRADLVLAHARPRRRPCPGAGRRYTKRCWRSSDCPLRPRSPQAVGPQGAASSRARGFQAAERDNFQFGRG